VTKKPAIALCKLQSYLLKNNLGLIIYDAYRPLRAVKHFARWFAEPISQPIEIEQKKIHYPYIDKHELDKLGYVAGETSRHNFGF
jgi:D-alanyl-D-alanine dipeptidase